jgi:hypothetical protein
MESLEGKLCPFGDNVKETNSRDTLVDPSNKMIYKSKIFRGYQ